MEKVQWAIVGCGGMGGRHLRGVQEFYGSDLCNMDLVACCDLRRDNAEFLADEAEKRLGKRPRVFTDMEAMVKALPELRVVDITTSTGSHHVVTSQALELGLNVMVEKPLAVTVRGCNAVMELAKRHPKQVLGVAEQYRRDPICRLMRALIDAGAIGAPYALFSLGASSSDKIIIFPWRHLKNIGGILTDAGVHTVDLMQYWMGPIREIYARTRLFEPVRYKSTATTLTSPFYEHWTGEIPEQMDATAEDTLMSVFTFESGVMGNWTSFNAAHGEGFGRTVAYGQKGSLRTEGARNGHPLELHLDDGGHVQGDDILKLVPDFHLNAITAALFGGERLSSYPFVFAEADRKLVAVEYHEMGECVLKGLKPEVDAATGRSALAVCHAALESGVLNRPVTVEEVIAEKTGVYEEDINAYWKV